MSSQVLYRAAQVAMAYDHSSGLPPWEAPGMIADKRRVVLSLQTSKDYISCCCNTVASHTVSLSMIRPCSHICCDCYCTTCATYALSVWRLMNAYYMLTISLPIRSVRKSPLFPFDPFQKLCHHYCCPHRHHWLALMGHPVAALQGQLWWR